MRKICTLERLGAKSARSVGTIRQDEVLRLISSIQVSAAGGKLVNLTEEVSRFTGSVVCRSAFGKVFEGKDNTLILLMQEVLSRSSGFDISDLFPSQKILHHLSWMKPILLKLHHKIDAILDNIINEHIENLQRANTGNGESGQEDLIDVLLRLRKAVTFNFQLPAKLSKLSYLICSRGELKLQSQLSNGICHRWSEIQT